MRHATEKQDASDPPRRTSVERVFNPVAVEHQRSLARALDVPATRIYRIVHGDRGITIDIALRLARNFGGDAASWLALQTA